LGIFVLFQLVYLPLANLIQLLPREMPPARGELDSPAQREGTASDVRPIQEAINGMGTAVDHWGELSGQTQRWSLFAPDVSRQSCFPVMKFYCVGPDEFATATFKPDIAAEPDHYIRLPSPPCRLYAYESLLAVVFGNFNEQSLAEHPEQWRQAIRERTLRQQKSLEAYFRWNLDLFKKRYPDEPAPVEMVLRVLIIPAPKPGESDRPASFEVPLARWRPSEASRPGYAPFDVYDPVAKEFFPLSTNRVRP